MHFGSVVFSKAADQSQLTQHLMRNTLIAIDFFNRNKKLITKNPRCNLFYLVILRTAVTQQHTPEIVMSQLVCCLWNVKCTAVTFYSFLYTFILMYFWLKVLILISVVSTFCWDFTFVQY